MDFIQDIFLIRIMIFLLILTITSQFLKKMIEKIPAAIISLVISLIGTYYMTSSQIDFFSKVYTLFGIGILLAVPFIIIFFILYSSEISGILRKAVWVLYSAILILLLNENENLGNEEISILITGIVLICLVILFLDNWIKKKLNINKHLKKKRKR